VTSLVQRLLLNRVRPYLTAHNGKWFYRNQVLTERLINDALHGSMPLGVAAVSDTGSARWTCLDVDQDVQLFELQELARQMSPLNCCLFEYSRRGGHLFIFHQVVPWSHAHAFGTELARKAGLEGIEVYPKHGDLNAVRLPGTTHPKTGERYPIIDPGTGEVLSLAAALSQIERYQLPQVQVDETPALSPKAEGTAEFTQLVDALQGLTEVKVSQANRGVAKCPWHQDQHPSLIIKGGRFHCARPDCVWGDIHDLRRYLNKGIRPPTH
jgi:hypothetical protein